MRATSIWRRPRWIRTAAINRPARSFVIPRIVTGEPSPRVIDCTVNWQRRGDRDDPRVVIRTVPGRVLDLAFPARCPGCGREGPPICDECRPALDGRLEQPAGIPIGLPSDIPAPLLQLEWCAPFSGVVRRALHGLKYSGETRLARPLGEAIARRWARVAAGGDVLVPVPVHAERRRRRGYDQAELLARAAAAELG